MLMKSSKTVSVNMQVPEAERDQWRKVAEEEGIHELSVWIKAVVRKYLLAKTTPPPPNPSKRKP